MTDPTLVQNYKDYLKVTDGDSMSAAILTLASVRQQTEQVLEKQAQAAPKMGTFGSVEKDD